MAGRLLFVILMYSFHKVQVQARLPPKLTVNSPVITETESVTLSCQSPSLVHVSQCYFYTLSGGTVTDISCLKTLTGTELLLMSHQSSPAEVQVKCFYTVKLGDLDSPSPHSDVSSITIHSQKPQMSLQHFPGEYVLFTCTLPGSAHHETKCNLYFGEASHLVLTTTIWRNTNKNKQCFCQFTVEINNLLRHLHLVQQRDASCDYSLGSEPNSLSPRSDGYSLTGIVEKESPAAPTQSTFTTTTDLTVAANFVTPVKSASDISEIASHTTQTMSTFTMTTGLTVSRPRASTPVTTAERTSGLTAGRPKITGSFISTSLTPVKPASETATTNLSTTISVTSAGSNITETWIWKFIVAAGLGVTVVVFGLGLGLALLCTKRRTDDVMCMRNLDHGGLLPAGNDEAYSVITSVPDCPTGSEKLTRQEPLHEGSDIYHVYATISEEPPPSALKDMVYSTLQEH